MTYMTHGSESAVGGRLGGLALRLVLAVILASPIGVGFWLAPKADDMPTPPELTAPPLDHRLARRRPPRAGSGPDDGAADDDRHRRIEV